MQKNLNPRQGRRLAQIFGIAKNPGKGVFFPKLGAGNAKHKTGKKCIFIAEWDYLTPKVLLKISRC